jgi:hypothetical protein
MYREKFECIKSVARENMPGEDVIHVLMIRFGFTYKQAKNFYNPNSLLNEPGRVKEADYPDED